MRFLKWLVAPHVAPLVARLLLVGATALLADPQVGVALGAVLEALRGNR